MPGLKDKVKADMSLPARNGQKRELRRLNIAFDESVLTQGEARALISKSISEAPQTKPRKSSGDGWMGEAPTHKQVSFLTRHGAETAGMNRGAACSCISAIKGVPAACAENAQSAVNAIMGHLGTAVLARNTPTQKFHIIMHSRAVCNTFIREDALYTKSLDASEKLCWNCAKLTGIQNFTNITGEK